MGDELVTELPSDVQVSRRVPLSEAAEQIKSVLRDEGVIFRPW
jgi:hypothetical protein